MPIPYLAIDDAKLFDAFNFCLPAWILIAFLPSWKPSIKIARHIALLFALMYTLILADAMFIHPDPNMDAAKMMESFSSLDGVHKLLSKRESILGAWCHYVVFDLWTGCWIAEDALKRVSYCHCLCYCYCQCYWYCYCYCYMMYSIAKIYLLYIINFIIYSLLLSKTTNKYN